MKKSGLLFLVIFFSFIFSNNHAKADAIESYNHYLEGKAIFIDVRELQEVNEGMVKGALWFPLSKIEADKKNEIAKIKEIALNKEIFLYCRSGRRSEIVRGFLSEASIPSTNLGGFSDLVDAKIPTQSGP